MTDEKKLNDFFKEVCYTCPNPESYQIIIKDDDKEKFNRFKVEDFHIINAKSLLLLYLSDDYPIFKIDIGKKIQMKDYRFKLIENEIIISVNIFNIDEIQKKFIRKNLYKYFINKLLKSIFNNYYINNSLLFYLENLKKKTIYSFQLNYLRNIKNKNTKLLLDKKIYHIYLSSYFKKLNQKVEKKNNNSCKNIKFYFNIFKYKINFLKSDKNRRNENVFKAITYFQEKRKINFYKVLYNNYINMKKIDKWGLSYHINKILETFIIQLRKNLKHKKIIMKRIQKYNKMNYLFLEMIAEKLNYHKFLIKINNQTIHQVFALLQSNLLQNKLIYQKFLILYVKKKNRIKEKIINEFHNYKKVNNQIIYKYKNLFFNNVTQNIYHKKIDKNKLGIIKCIIKQNTIQTYFKNVLRQLQYKNVIKELFILWHYKKRMKFIFYDFIRCLFISKKKKEIELIQQNSNGRNNNDNNNDNNDKIFIGISNSFQIKSTRLLIKSQKLLVKKVKKHNIYKRFFFRSQIIIKNNYLKYQINDYNSKKFKKDINNFLKEIKKEIIIKKKAKKVINKNIIYAIKQLNKNNKKNKVYNAASNTYFYKLMIKSFKILYHYNKFKKEKKLRYDYFGKKLKKIYKKFIEKKYISNISIGKNKADDALLFQKHVNYCKYLGTLSKLIKYKKLNTSINKYLKKNIINEMIKIKKYNNQLKRKTWIICNKYYKKELYNRFILKIRLINKYKRKINKLLFKYHSNIFIYRLRKKALYNKANNFLEFIFLFNYFKKKCSLKSADKISLDSKRKKLFTKLFFIKFKILSKNEKNYKKLKNLYKKYFFHNKFVTILKVKKIQRCMNLLLNYILKKEKDNFIGCLKDNLCNIKYNKFIKTKSFNKFKKICIVLFRRKNNLVTTSNLFNKKYILKHIMKIRLLKMKKYIIKKKKKNYILRIFKTKCVNLYKKHNSKNGLKSIIKKLQQVNMKNKLNYNKKYFSYIKNKIHFKKVNAIYCNYIHPKFMMEFDRYLSIIRISIKYNSLILNKIKKEKCFFMNMLKKHALFKVNSQIFFYNHLYKMFINQLKNMLKSNKLLISMIKFNRKNNYKIFTHIIKGIKKPKNDEKKEQNKKIVNQIHNSYINMLKGNYIKQFKNILQYRKNLKKKIFNILKKNAENSNDLNYYLKEAKKIK